MTPPPLHHTNFTELPSVGTDQHMLTHIHHTHTYAHTHTYRHTIHTIHTPYTIHVQQETISYRRRITRDCACVCGCAPRLCSRIQETISFRRRITIPWTERNHPSNPEILHKLWILLSTRPSRTHTHTHTHTHTYKNTYAYTHTHTHTHMRSYSLSPPPRRWPHNSLPPISLHTSSGLSSANRPKLLEVFFFLKKRQW